MKDWVALFGGTFDPPHLGHRQAVRDLIELAGVQRVLILPSASPAYKPTVASREDRVAMARLCFGPTAAEPDYPARVEFDLRELDRAARTGRPTYTFDT